MSCYEGTRRRYRREAEGIFAGQEEGGAEGPLFPGLGGQLAHCDDFVALYQPDGAAAVAFQQVFRVAVGMHVDLDTFDAVTIRAMHVNFLLAHEVSYFTI
jgi:hypothetical protein